MRSLPAEARGSMAACQARTTQHGHHRAADVNSHERVDTRRAELITQEFKTPAGEVEQRPAEAQRRNTELDKPKNRHPKMMLKMEFQKYPSQPMLLLM